MTLEGAMTWMLTGYVVMGLLLIVGWWIHAFKNRRRGR